MTQSKAKSTKSDKLPIGTSVSKERTPASIRRLRRPKHSFRMRAQIKQNHKKLPNAFRLFKDSLTHILKYWKVFLGITVIYLLLTILLVKGFGVSSNVGQLKSNLQSVFHGNIGAFTTGLTIFGVLLGSAGKASSDVAGAYQSILLIVTSLALIWALRQTHAKIKISVKDCFYRGMYPLIQFILVLLVIGIQLIPILIAAFLYNFIFSNGIAVKWYEQIGWTIAIILLSLWSLYLLSSSIFALYIVTLPDVRPLQAIRSARELVRYRRWSVLRKIVFLPIVLLLVGALIILPLIIFAAPVVEWVFFGLTMTVLAIVHSYMYGLYRQML